MKKPYSNAAADSRGRGRDRRPHRPPRPSQHRTLGDPSQPPDPSQKLHKVLAQSGMGSRRGMEQMIGEGRVTVNGEPATVGRRVSPRDRVQLGGRALEPRFKPASARVLIYYKQDGEIVSRDDPEGRPSVFDRLPRMKHDRWVAVGRLDFNTGGLLLFTTDGELANRLMHPRNELEREYAVRTMGRLGEEQMDRLTEGIELDDGPANVNSIEDRGGEGLNHWYHVTLMEGRNREVRRLFEAVGVTISRLIRVRFGPIDLPPHLKRGRSQELTPQQVQALKRAVGLQASEAGVARGDRGSGRSTPRNDAARGGHREPGNRRAPGAGRHSPRSNRPPREGLRQAAAGDPRARHRADARDSPSQRRDLRVSPQPRNPRNPGGEPAEFQRRPDDEPRKVVAIKHKRTRVLSPQLQTESEKT